MDVTKVVSTVLTIKVNARGGGWNENRKIVEKPQHAFALNKPKHSIKDFSFEAFYLVFIIPRKPRATM